MSKVFIEQTVRELVNRPYQKIIFFVPGEGYFVKVPDLSGCMSDGPTEAEALANVREAMAGWFETALANDIPIPEPSDLIERLAG